MNNSMVKKLYSSRKDKKDNGKNKENSDEEEMGAMSSIIESEAKINDGQGKIIKEMKQREVFTYKYIRWWVYTCWLLPRCCIRERREDRLWKDATSKLSREIDLLEIIKNQRIYKMGSQMQYSRKQREIVKFF